MNIVIGHLHDLGVETELIRPVDFNIPFGVESDLGDGDEWPQILEKILEADILIIGMSIWFGVRNSVCQMVIERLDGTYNSTNEVGQYPMYNKVGGVVVTGNEDGAHAAAETTVFNLTHLGFTIPPNADTYWVGDAGPGPSFLDAGGDKHPYTLKTAGWMAHNVVHMAGSEEHLVEAAVTHAVTAHKHEDSPELREEIRKGMKEEVPGALA